MEIVKILMVSRYAGTAVSGFVRHFNISNKSEIKWRKTCFAPKNLVPLHCQNEGNIARKLKKIFSPVRQQKQQY